MTKNVSAVAGHLGIDSDAPGTPGALGADFAHAAAPKPRADHPRRSSRYPSRTRRAARSRAASRRLRWVSRMTWRPVSAIDADLPRAGGAVARRLRERGGDLGGCELGRRPFVGRRDRELEGAARMRAAAASRARARATRAASTSARARAGCGARSANRCPQARSCSATSYSRPGSSGVGSACESRCVRLSSPQLTSSDSPVGATSSSLAETSARGRSALTPQRERRGCRALRAARRAGRW